MSDPLFHPLTVICAGSCFAFSGLFYKLYSDKRLEVQKLKEIPNFQPDHHLLRILNASSNKRLHYVAVEGLVQAVGEPISSQYVPRCHGVIQKITVHEHWKYWNSLLKSWVSKKVNKQQTTNTVPFTLVQPGSFISDVCVRVDSPLEASGDFLQQVHRRVRNAKEGLMDAVLGEISGEKPIALEEREDLLRVGVPLTAFGELVLEQEKIMRIQPPKDGRSFVLIPSDYNSFMQRHQNSVNMWKGLTVLFGLTGSTLLAGFIHAGLKDRKTS
ncbi:mitochondrial ubiquitin ligase activator of nfkb 1-A [Danio rerio]|uniref:RING-type E3 ubiquitin transferase n=1 Tax=Danio rerio TaxID=7955 RepID=A0A8M2BIE5_DANRE|nr:mitochondrial ubiquitin ligase activator of nfkb 1-A [Danio rerio]XP_005171183.1 mitochondrial ubiquitin ligase activator of nfkb 1-A [Danio rerio]XP_005171184.1 mitochondrial ubiquitin ligase activator of nfkb 1-A [Danio rerio]XP_017206789.1 mitochondrial ubiquitin ligase activator of nfkb 1-A [Danio rerio]|eukprot:XP_005171182.1 mitochondrial ubiquitin ligase activator of nfkb 1-A [Danio rerio]